MKHVSGVRELEVKENAICNIYAHFEKHLSNDGIIYHQSFIKPYDSGK